MSALSLCKVCLRLCAVPVPVAACRLCCASACCTDAVCQQRPDVFKVAVSGAPVIDWESYGT